MQIKRTTVAERPDALPALGASVAPNSLAELRAEWDNLPNAIREATMNVDEGMLVALDSRKRVLPVLLLRAVLQDAETAKESIDAHHADAVLKYQAAEALRDIEHQARNAAQAKLNTAQAVLSEREAEMRMYASYAQNALNAVHWTNSALTRSTDDPAAALATLEERVLPLLSNVQSAAIRLEAERGAK